RSRARRSGSPTESARPRGILAKAKRERSGIRNAAVRGFVAAGSGRKRLPQSGRVEAAPVPEGILRRGRVRVGGREVFFASRGFSPMKIADSACALGAGRAV